MRGKFRFPKSARILRSSDFRRIYDNGVRHSCPYFTAFFLREQEGGEVPVVGGTRRRAPGGSASEGDQRESGAPAEDGRALPKATHAGAQLSGCAQGGPRVGFTVGRGAGNAVVRNRLKRRMREAVRLRLHSLEGEWAIVFNPRRAAHDAPFEALCREVDRLFERCRNS